MKFKAGKSPGYMTNRAARLFARAIDRHLAPLGLSSGHLPVFFALADGKTLTQKALSANAAVEQPTMAATLNRMERDGLITRLPNPVDRRSSLVSLTPLAQAKAPQVLDAIRTVNAAATTGLKPARQKQYLKLVAEICAGLEAHLAASHDEP